MAAIVTFVWWLYEINPQICALLLLKPKTVTYMNKFNGNPSPKIKPPEILSWPGAAILGSWRLRPPDFGQGVAGGLQGVAGGSQGGRRASWRSWMGREILLYLIMYRNYVQKW